jgi:type II secretory pathway predicted ATPase ExeA
MRVEVMQHYGLTLPFEQAGYYETHHHQQLMADIKASILEGRLVVVCGIVGCGKTTLMRRLQQQLEEEKRITVSRSVAIEKNRVTLSTLMSALYYDLSSERKVRIPPKIEQRDRGLQELLKKNKRPVALFVDEAHDLNGNTLIGLKRLMELAREDNTSLSIVLAGHPKLRNDLRRPTMEEIGYRADIYSLDGIAGSQREYLRWLLETCTAGKQEISTLLTEEAVDLLAGKLRTPLQIQQHLSLALEAGYLTGERPVTAALVQSVLSRHIDDLEPQLTRHGYRMKDLVELFEAKPAEIRALFGNTLDAERANELRDKIRGVGLPI